MIGNGTEGCQKLSIDKTDRDARELSKKRLIGDGYYEWNLAEKCRLTKQITPFAARSCSKFLAQ